MSCLRGNIDITYDELVGVFGMPTLFGEGCKTDAEWKICCDGEEIYIYNYKDGKNYCGEDGLDIEDITDWNIGGDSDKVVELVKQRIEFFRYKKSLNETI